MAPCAAFYLRLMSEWLKYKRRPQYFSMPPFFPPDHDHIGGTPASKVALSVLRTPVLVRRPLCDLKRLVARTSGLSMRR